MSGWVNSVIPRFHSLFLLAGGLRSPRRYARVLRHTAELGRAPEAHAAGKERRQRAEPGSAARLQSIADLLRTTIQDAQDLVRGEIALARAELGQEVRRTGAALTMLAAAGLTAIIALVFLLTAVAWGIPAALAWPVWTGFAIVGGIVLVTAAALAMIGRNRLNGHPHMPLTVETMKETMQWTRARKS
jgi:hypothetical protein